MLRVANLSKEFAQVRALHDVSFTVVPGAVVGFLGPNGAGKTTTMRAIMGLITRNAGTVDWNGSPIDERTRRQIGYLPAERGMYLRMKVDAHLTYYARLSGMDETMAKRAAEKWIARLGLTEYATQPIQGLSSGNQQRVQLAMALIGRPNLLLLDEPFSGLDPLAVVSLREVLLEEAERGAAVLLSSHQLDLVADLCSSVVAVDQGRVVLQGEVAELRAASTRRTLEVTFLQPTTWHPVAGSVIHRGDLTYRIDLDDNTEPEPLLADAATHGKITEYSYRPPDLSEIFLSSLNGPGRN